MGAYPLFEVVQKRTENAKHFLMSDGTYQAIISAGPLHYQDDSGTWQNIDSTIVDPVAVAVPKQPINHTQSNNGGWAHSNHFTTPYNKVDLRLPKNIKSGYSVGWGKDRLTFTPDKASPSLGQVNPVNPSEVDYQDVWVDTDITLEAMYQGVKETIVLKSNNSPTTFSFSVAGPIANDWTSGTLQTLAPWYEDANGTRKDATISQRAQGSQTFVDITVDPTGMTFPITVDPSVTITGPSNEKYYCTQASYMNTAVSVSGGYMMESGTWGSSEGQIIFAALYPLTSIPSGSTVVSAQFQSSEQQGAYAAGGAWTMPFWIQRATASISWGSGYATVPMADDGNAHVNISSASSPKGTSYSFDLTQTVQQWINGATNYGFLLAPWSTNNSSSSGQAIYPYISGGGAQLVVNYDFPPSAPTVTAPNGGETINTTFNVKWNAAANNQVTSIGSVNLNPAPSTYGQQSIEAATSGYNDQVAQLFTVPSGVTSIKDVQVVLANTNAANLLVYVELETVSGTNPSGTLINNNASVTQQVNGNTSNYSAFTVTFPSPIPVTPGSTYALVIVAANAGAGTIVVYEDGANPAPSNFTQNAQHHPYGGSWTTDSGYYLYAQIDFLSSNSSLTYQIDLSQNNGSTWSNIVSATAAGATSYTYDFTNTPASSTNLIRVRAYDGTAYGPYDQSNGVFTIQHDRAPTSPTNLSPSSGAVDHTQPITASWTFNDPDTGDSQSKFNIKWSTNGGSTWTEIDGTVTASTSYTWPANTFSDGQVVQWAVQTYDTSGLNSPWSAQAQFTAGTIPGTPTITSPANNATVATANPTIQWSSSGQTDYQLQVQDTSNNVLWDSGDVVSTNVAATLSAYNLANSTTYQFALRVKNSQGLWSAWTKNTFNVSYTPPAPSTTTATADNANARIVVTIVDPPPSGSQPTVSSHDLYRRNSGSTAWTRIATGLAAGTYYDYAVASNQAYDYKVTAIGNNGTQVDSLIISSQSISMTNTGLWVHDVNNPSGTLMNLQYYNASTQSADGSVPQNRQWTPAATSMKFAGRNRPVIEFGENDTFELSYKNIVMLATTTQWPILEALIRVNKSTLCFRDGRGTMIFGCVLGYQETDLVFGNMVDLALEQTAYTLAV